MFRKLIAQRRCGGFEQFCTVPDKIVNSGKNGQNLNCGKSGQKTHTCISMPCKFGNS